MNDFDKAEMKHDQEKADNYYDEDCEQCEDWKQRGDELFDELEHIKDEYDELADRLKGRDNELERLMNLLIKNGVCLDIEEEESGVMECAEVETEEEE